MHQLHLLFTKSKRSHSGNVGKMIVIIIALHCKEKGKGYLPSFLFGFTDSNSAASAASGLGVLSTHTQSVVMTDATVAPNLLQSFHVLTELVVEIVDEQVVILSVANVLSSVDHPKGNFVFEGVLDDVDYALKIRLCEFSGT